VTDQSPGADVVARPSSVTSAISALGLGSIAGLVDGSLVAVDNVCLTSTSSTSAATDSLSGVFNSLLG
jgi:hypothetical protein